MDNLTVVVGFIIVLSIASERLVEIIKQFVPILNKEIDVSTDNGKKREGKRRSLIQILAVLSGIVTAFLAQDYLPQGITKPTNNFSIIGLGLLASGGSGFWNSILTYLLQVKNIQKAEVVKAQLDTAEAQIRLNAANNTLGIS
jgi:hypothetical protein